MALINAERAKKNPPLPPISLAARILNVDVGGIFGSVDALTFTYTLFNYGKQREGYWDSEKMVQQTNEIMSMLEFKYPGKQLVFLFDWSSGHDKKPQDSVILSKLNLQYGGKSQPAMRSTTILENYAGNAPLYPPLTPGCVQHLVFQPGDPPPFYKPNLPAQDYVGLPKGAKQIAFERGLWKTGKRTAKCVLLLFCKLLL